MDGSGSEEDELQPRARDNRGERGSGKKPKPALVKKKRQQSKEKHLKWDEVAITEHNQLRGTRMKIDEPKTPFEQYDSGAESEDSKRAKSPGSQKPQLSWDVLQTKLDSVAAVRDAYPSSPSEHAETDHSDACSDVEEEKRKEMRKLEFKEHRKRHYNEMEALKRFRAQHPDDVAPGGEDQAEEDDEDGDADDEA
jgi:protein phosphatase inhibitor 2